MSQLYVIPVVVLAIVLFLAWRAIDPKLDWNYETGERLLWYNDPFDVYYRKSIVLYTKKEN